MVKIYRDYQDEPDDVFQPLPEDLAAGFYALEMESFSEDSVFFENALPRHGAVLEMGCGTGRVVRRLAQQNRPMTGIDISMPMLRLAIQHRHPYCSFFCMDMLAPAFRKPFEAVLIPYNTLNLLGSEQTILRCLHACKASLRREGRLIVQIFIPTTDFLSNERTTFQFQTFNRPGGGRIIKEILKKYLPESQKVQLEERYRIRPMQERLVNEDYHTRTYIAAFSLEKWLAVFAEASFAPEHIYGSYNCAPFDAALSSCCLLILRHQ